MHVGESREDAGETEVLAISRFAASRVSLAVRYSAVLSPTQVTNHATCRIASSPAQPVFVRVDNGQAVVNSVAVSQLVGRSLLTT
jgi:hypothetical protein